jgi:hypothetical protein
MTDPRTLSDYQELFRSGNAHTKMCWGMDCPGMFGRPTNSSSEVRCDCPHHDLPPSPRDSPPKKKTIPVADVGAAPGTILSADSNPPPMPAVSPPGASFSEHWCCSICDYAMRSHHRCHEGDKSRWDEVHYLLAAPKNAGGRA